MVKLIVSVFYIGFLPKAPGTFGSIAAVFLGYWLQILGGFPLLTVFTVLFFLLGWAMSYQYLIENSLKHDPQEIVIDEVVGQWITFLPISLYMYISETSSSTLLWLNWLIALILFRIFDVWKPWPVSWADKKTTSLGVMLDDVLAGIYAAFLICVMLTIYHTVKL